MITITYIIAVLLAALHFHADGLLAWWLICPFLIVGDIFGLACIYNVIQTRREGKSGAKREGEP